MANHSAAAFWYSLCNLKSKEKVMENVGRRMAQRYEIYCDALKQAAGLKDLPPAQRLEAYRGRAPQTWRLLEKVWPEQKKSQSDDWQKLETSALNQELAKLTVRHRIPASVME